MKQILPIALMLASCMNIVARNAIYHGSINVVVGANGELWQFNDYHVTGIPSSQFGQLNADDHLHTGKEYNAFNGLHMYDNNARTQDPILGRFTTPDPLAEKYPGISPYAHCANNPLKYIDPTGMEWLWYPTIKEKDRENIDEYSNEKINREYEVKVATDAILSGTDATSIPTYDTHDWRLDFEMGKYGNSNHAILPYNLPFKTDYVKYGNKFVKHYTRYNLGDSHYRVPVTGVSKTFNKLIYNATKR